MTRMPPPINEYLKPVLQRKHALQAARRLRARDKSVQAYRCRDCGGWHVGTSNGAQKQRRIKTLRTNHQPHLEKRMPISDQFTVRDVYARHTDKSGKSYVTSHRVWNAERFFSARAAEAAKEGGKARCEQITEEQYRKERA